jgi:hypothetical protein
VTLVVPPKDFSLSASPASATISRGQTATYSVSVAPSGGFTGSVTLTIAGQPSGSTPTLSINPVGSGATSTLRVRTTGSTARGTFTVKITGKNGSLTHQVTVTLTVK